MEITQQDMDRSVCVVCEHRVTYIVYSSSSMGEEHVHDAWWAHNTHPSDGHDAVVADAAR